jgi:DNA repair photolyase
MTVLRSIAPAKKEQTMAARILFKVEKERALVPVGEPCPFGCKYCYMREGEVGLRNPHWLRRVYFRTLYADDRGQFVRFISPEILETVPNRKDVVSWSAHSPIWKRYEDETRLRQLTAMIEGKGGKVFLSSADAMAMVSQKRSGTLPGPLKG